MLFCFIDRQRLSLQTDVKFAASRYCTVLVALAVLSRGAEDVDLVYE